MFSSLNAENGRELTAPGAMMNRTVEKGAQVSSKFRSVRPARSVIVITMLLFATLPFTAPTPAVGASQISATAQTPGDLDARVGSVAPTAAQRSTANSLGAHVTWNRFGTPASLIKYGGNLATGLSGTPVNAARNWISSRAGLFRLTAADVSNLELVNDSILSDGVSHAVMFRQRFGSLPATQDGLITVGIKNGNVAYVSSSIAGHQNAPAPATLTAQQAWLSAANSVGLPAAAGDISNVHQRNGWTVFSAAGFDTPLIGNAKGAQTVGQRARLVALPTYTQGVKAAYEVDVLRNRPGLAVIGYVMFVDARTGAVLFRHNAVDEAANGVSLVAAGASGFFTGVTGTNPQNALCGPNIEIPVVRPADNRIDVVATADVPADDIVIFLFRPDNSLAASSDTATSPEALDYQLIASDPSGLWYARVCEFTDVANFSYTGFFQVSAAGTPPVFAFPPQWNFFTANPALPAGPLSPPFTYPNTDNRTNACWTTNDPGAPADCEMDLTPNVGDTNLASRVPWDHNVQTNAPNFQTLGNNAFTAEAWNAALTPGSTAQRPIDLDRTYGFLEIGDPGSLTGPLEGWTNSWNRTRCGPLAQTPAENNIDVLAAATTLHAGHNRLHDFSYHLGFTERNFNMQTNNFGQTPPGPFPLGREGDPEIGNVQNGATLAAAVGLTRDNANQITLQDGIPGITNQYLFQPIAGAFYAPCADGDLDASIYGHEYTHAISNRMVGGPDSGLTGHQAGSMGESWSDQVAIEYLNEFKFVPTSTGENPFAVGIYATGNKQRAIRNYGMNNSPLNYSDVGYDMVCTASLVGPPVEPDCEGPEGQVHADGEIWSAVGHDIRQALIQKYNGAFPAGSASLQRRCANGILPADQCPGNRRWIQIMFDAFLLQQGDTDMLTARDAYLAADQLIFNGANQTELWRAFARRGFGSCAVSPTNACHATRSAFTNGTGDVNPIPSFESPLEGEKTVNFAARSSATGAAVTAKLFVGRFEARVTPIADTDGSTALGATARFVPGTYSLLVQAKGYGLKRFQLVASGTGTSNVSLSMAPNFASSTNGATATGVGANFADLIDDSEATTWDVANTGTNVDVAQPQVTVDLSGTGAQMVRSVKVSALLTPTEARFTALRQFRIQACNAAPPVNANCALPGSFSTIFTSTPDAFNAIAPRPVAPDLLIKSFDVTDTAATHVRLVALHNQCTGGPHFQGEQDNDPLNATDCSDVSERAHELHVAELQVLGTRVDGSEPSPSAPKDPVVLLTKTGPATAAAGANVSYTLSYQNLGPAAATSATLVDTLPAGVSFVSATGGGSFNATNRTVTWTLGNVANGASGSRTLVVRINGGTPSGRLLLNQVEFIAPLTVSTPGAFLTLVT
jgi:extracellular elastinolytic metalloproteinase